MRILLYTTAILIATGACLAWPRALKGGLSSMVLVFVLSLVARATLLGGLLLAGVSRELRVEAVLAVVVTQLVESCVACWHLWQRPTTSRAVAA